MHSSPSSFGSSLSSLSGDVLGEVEEPEEDEEQQQLVQFSSSGLVNHQTMMPPYRYYADKFMLILGLDDSIWNGQKTFCLLEGWLTPQTEGYRDPPSLSIE